MAALLREQLLQKMNYIDELIAMQARFGESIRNRI